MNNFNLTEDEMMWYYNIEMNKIQQNIIDSIEL